METRYCVLHITGVEFQLVLMAQKFYIPELRKLADIDFNRTAFFDQSIL